MSDPHNEFKDKNVLIERKSPSEMAPKFAMPVEKYLHILGQSRKKLFEVRSSRPRPHLDDKVLSLDTLNNIMEEPSSYSFGFAYFQAQIDRSSAF